MRPPNTADLSRCTLHKFLIDLGRGRGKNWGRDENERREKGRDPRGGKMRQREGGGGEEERRREEEEREHGGEMEKDAEREGKERM